MNKKVLIAEDNLSVRLVTRAVLELEGYEVHTASNGTDAFNKAISQPYDLILMDVQMPEQDGITTTEKIRQVETATNRASTPILAYSSQSSGASQEKCLKCGMNDFIPKPTDAVTLTRIIKEWLLK